jgi:hypothetical protein
VSRIKKALVASTTAVTIFVLAMLLALSTARGASSLRGLQGWLSGDLHAIGLITDVHAGGGGTSMASGPGTSEAATVGIGSSAKLIARVYAAVPVTVSCAQLPGPVAYGGISVQLVQAQGRTVVQGYGFASLPPNACSGSTATYTVNAYPPMTASGTTVPYKGGQAAASAFVFACDSSNACASGSAGPQKIQISG